jgi:hypothetical protein
VIEVSDEFFEALQQSTCDGAMPVEEKDLNNR